MTCPRQIMESILSGPKALGSCGRQSGKSPISRSRVRGGQPGIESLSTHVLKLMRKGVRSVDNVNLLRWTLYYRIRVSWNLIWGFPQETEEDYVAQENLIQKIVHLPPPAAYGRIWME